MKDTIQAIGFVISFLMGVILICQFWYAYSYLIEVDNPARYEILHVISYFSLFSIVLWAPGILVGMIAKYKYQLTGLGAITLGLSGTELLVSIWSILTQ